MPRTPRRLSVGQRSKTNINGVSEDYRTATRPDVGWLPAVPIFHLSCHAPAADVRLETLNTKVDELQPTGNTNVTIGLSWAFHALTA